MAAHRSGCTSLLGGDLVIASEESDAGDSERSKDSLDAEDRIWIRVEQIRDLRGDDGESREDSERRCLP